MAGIEDPSGNIIPLSVVCQTPYALASSSTYRLVLSPAPRPPSHALASAKRASKDLLSADVARAMRESGLDVAPSNTAWTSGAGRGARIQSAHDSKPVQHGARNNLRSDASAGPARPPSTAASLGRRGSSGRADASEAVEAAAGGEGDGEADIPEELATALLEFVEKLEQRQLLTAEEADAIAAAVTAGDPVVLAAYRVCQQEADTRQLAFLFQV